MKDAAPKTIYLKDYTPFGFVVESVHLTFRLAPTATRVISKIAFAPNPDATDGTFFLHGEELKLLWAKIDGADVTPTVTEDGLRCDVPDGPFTWEAEVEISPETNTALEGLYMSNGMYCTQCEAEGFRKITWFPDRPDGRTTIDAFSVLAGWTDEHTVRIRGYLHPPTTGSYLFTTSGRIDLYLLISASQNSYTNALIYLSRIVSFFQAKNVFNPCISASNN